MMDAARTSRTFEAHRESVYGWAFRILGNHHDALDVTQEVFIKWWGIHREKTAPTRAVGWLRRVTINHSINLCKTRCKQSDAAVDDRADTDVGMPPAERREIADALASAMTTMSEHQRAVLFAKVYDACTFAEIATQMGIAVPTVKTHYLRAIRTARRTLADAGLVAGDES